MKNFFASVSALALILTSTGVSNLAQASVQGDTASDAVANLHPSNSKETDQTNRAGTDFQRLFTTTFEKNKAEDVESDPSEATSLDHLSAFKDGNRGEVNRSPAVLGPPIYDHSYVKLEGTTDEISAETPDRLSVQPSEPSEIPAEK